MIHQSSKVQGGYFATCSCSHYMDEEQLKKTVAEAAHDARRTLRQIEGY